MWALEFLPVWIFHIILSFGILILIVSWFLKFAPVVLLYRVPMQILGVLLTVLGVWYEGGIAKKEQYEQQIKDLKIEIANAKAASGAVNTKTDTVFLDKVKVVKDTQVLVQEKIRDISIKIDPGCKITSETIDVLNDSAKNQKPK